MSKLHVARSMLALFALISFTAGPNAFAGTSPTLSSCIHGSGGGVISGSQLIVSVNLEITCTVTSPTNPNIFETFGSVLSPYSYPVFEIVEDSLFINSQTGYCTDSSLMSALLASGASGGTVVCKIPLNLTSRYGATSSTLRIYTGDSIEITVSHPPIPSPSSSTSGSSGSGLAQNSTLGCTAAPNAPTISVTPATVINPPVFTITAPTGGAVPTLIGYFSDYYDGTTRTWDAWSNLMSQPTSVGNVMKFIPTLANQSKTRVAVEAVAINACGSSSAAWDNLDKTGTVLQGQPSETQALTVNIEIYKNGLSIGTDVTSLTALVQQQYPAPLHGTSSTPNICGVTPSNQINTYEVGQCNLTVISDAHDDVSAGETLISFNVVANSQPNANDSGSSFINNLLNTPIPPAVLGPLNNPATNWLYGQDIFGYSCWQLTNLKTAPQLQVDTSAGWKTVSTGTMMKDLHKCPTNEPIRVTYHWKVNIYGAPNPKSPHEQVLQVREYLQKNTPFNNSAYSLNAFTKGMFPSRMDQIAAYLDVIKQATGNG